MKKIILSFSVLIFCLIFFFIYLGKTAIVSTTGKTFAEKIASKIPEKQKRFLKKKFFKNEMLKLEIQNQNKLILELQNKERKKNNIILDKYNKIYFEKPRELLAERDDYSIFLFQTKFLANGKNDFAIASGYLDLFEEHLIVVTGDGLLFRIKTNEIINSKSDFFAHKINTNFRKLINIPEFFKKSYFGIKDVLIMENKIFLSFSNEVYDNCFNTGILKGDMNLNFIEFEKISLTKEDCVKKDKMDNALQGGRLVKYSKDEILFSHGDWMNGEKAQDKESIFGKIIKFNIKDNTYKIISYGHRNPQGLLYLKEANLVFETEHGPIGGDEINLINLNDNNIEKNYGWPIASYGVGEQRSAKTFTSTSKKYKSHDGFIEPIKYYVPSIGISEIVRVSPTFFEKNSENYDFFVSSLGTKISEGDMSLHHIEIDQKSFKILNNNIIPIQERIRDVIYHKKSESLILFIESDRMFKGGPSIAIFKFNKVN